MEVIRQVGFEQVPGGFFHGCFHDDVLGAFGFDAREAEFFAQLFEFHDADELLGGNGNGTIAILRCKLFRCHGSYRQASIGR